MITPSAMSAREREIEIIRAAVAHVLRTGRGQLLVVTGEPGIGKTALARWAVGHAAAHGLLVARGSAVDDPGAPARWPWMRAARELPGIAAALRLPGGDDDDGASARFAMHVAVADAVRDAARPAGLVLVLEDVHWADTGSLALLRHVAGELADMPVLVLATARTGAGFDLSVLSDGLDSAVVPLFGLDRDGVISWLRRTPGTSAWVPQADSLVELTGGNPLYLRLLVDHLPWTDMPSPDQVQQLLADRPDLRSLVLARFERLPPDVRELLEPASLQAEKIDLPTLVAASGRPVAEVSRLLDAAVSAGVLRIESNAHYFRHALVRDAVCSGLSTSKRRALHGRIAGALVRKQESGSVGMLAGTIAEHWSRAGGASAELLQWSHRASAEARVAFAYEEAARFAGQAAACAADLARPGAERAELVIDKAAALFAAGCVPEAVEAAAEAADLAESAGRPDLIGRAALVTSGIGTPEIYRQVAVICTRALTALADEPDRWGPLRARLLAQLAVASAEDGDGIVAAEQAADALRLAESSGDAEAILDAIAARHYTIAVPGTVIERIALAERAIGLASKSIRPMAALWGQLWRIDAAFQLGDLTSVERHLGDVDLLARKHRAPLACWHYERLLIARAGLVGDFAAAREHNGRARDLAVRMDDSSLSTMYYACRCLLAQICGDPFELDATMLAMAASALPQPLIQIGRATAAIVAGDLAAGAAAFDELRDLPRRFPVGNRWASTLGQIGTLATMLGDAEVAGDVFELLLPTASYCNGEGSGAIFCMGSNARLLGDLALTAGRPVEAIRLYQDAIAVNTRIGARPYTALSRLGWAQALLDLARQKEIGMSGLDDLHTSSGLVLLSAAEFRRLGMPGPLQRAVGLERRITAQISAHNPLSARENEVAVLVAGGLTNREIATRLILSERTVESHVRATLTKLGVRSRTDIAAWAVRAETDQTTAAADRTISHPYNAS